MKKYFPFFTVVMLAVSPLSVYAGGNQLDKHQILEILTQSAKANTRSTTQKTHSSTDTALQRNSLDVKSQVSKSNTIVKKSHTNNKEHTAIVKSEEAWEGSGLYGFS